MANLTKILLLVLIMILSVLGVEGYYYWQLKSKVETKTQKTEKPVGLQQTSAPNAPSTAKQVMYLGGLDIKKIDKKKVEEWGVRGGVISLDSEEKKEKVNVLAGRFVSDEGLRINLDQGGNQQKINLTDSSQIFIKKETDNLPILAIIFTNSSLSNGASPLTYYISKDDLLLFLDVSQKDGHLSSPNLVIFK